MLRVIILIIVSIYSLSAFAQEKIRHHLETIKTSKDPRKVIDAKSGLFLEYYKAGDKKQGDKYYAEALNDAFKLNYYSGLASIYNNKAMYFFDKDEFDSTLNYINLESFYAIKGNDKEFILKSRNNLGSVYYMFGDYKKALNIYIDGLKKEDSLKVPEGTYISVTNVAFIYMELALFNEAKKILYKAEKLYSKENTRGRSMVYVYEALSTTFLNLKNADSALVYANKALELSLKLKMDDLTGYQYLALASIYNEANEYDEAIENYNKAIEFYKLTRNERLGMDIYGELSELYQRYNMNQKADECYEQLMNLSEKFDIPADKITFYRNFAFIANKRKEYKKAYDYLNEYIINRDTIYNVQMSQQVAELKEKYESDKKEKENALLQKDKEKAEADLNNQKTIRNYLMSVVVLFVLIFVGSVFVYRKIKSINKQLETTNNSINQKNELLEIQKKEILDSITYAKRIQNAILPPLRLVKELLPDSFILYIPKDIVAGDFYWMEHQQDSILFAAADCTGHGVPGAMVSVVCHNGLNRSVREFGLTDPGKILDKTREIIIQEFEKSDEEVKDGMDISLCSLDLKKRKLHWAGANNPLWIIRKGFNEVEEIKPNKQPIGKYTEPKPFTTHSLQLQEGDTIYIFTDGFQDQFGGEKGKKFKASKLKELLTQLNNKTMEEQRSRINDEFEQWKGMLEQVDDVCIIGVRV